MEASVEEDKDTVIHVTKEEEDVSQAEAGAETAKDENDQMSAVGPDGEIDWDCPCLQGQRRGERLPSL